MGHGLDVDEVFGEVGDTVEFLGAYLTFKFVHEMALLAGLELLEELVELPLLKGLPFPLIEMHLHVLLMFLRHLIGEK